MRDALCDECAWDSFGGEGTHSRRRVSTIHSVHADMKKRIAMCDECAWYLGGQRVVSKRSSSHTQIQLQYIMANMYIWHISIPYMSQIYIYYTYMICVMYSRRRTWSEQMMRQLHTSWPPIYIWHTCTYDIYIDQRYTYTTHTWHIWYILGGEHAASKRCGSYT